MEFTVNAKQLLSRLSEARKGLHAKTALPILQCFLLEVDGDYLTITSSDSENLMSFRISVQNSEHASSSVCVEAAMFYDVIKSLSNMDVKISVDAGNMHIHTEISDQNLPVQNASEYPLIKVSHCEYEFSVTTLTLSEMFNNVLFAVKEDLLRPTLSCCLLELSPDKLTVVGTDGQVLVTSSCPLNIDYTGQFLLPVQSFKHIMAVLGDDENVKVFLGEQYVRFITEESSVLVRLATGRYVNYMSIMPNDNHICCDFDAKDMLNAINIVSTCQNKLSSAMKLNISLDRIVAASEDASFSTSAASVVPCSCNEGISLLVNSSYTANIIRRVPSDRVSLYLKDSSRAMMFRPSEESSVSFCAILMPMKS